MSISLTEAVDNTMEWLDRNSGWAPPDPDSIEEWISEGVCRCPDECLVDPAVPCPHGLASWWLVLRCLDRPRGRRPIRPGLLAPHPDRLSPDRDDFVAVMDAHHDAIVAGTAGYLDPTSGLFAQTARTLWDRGSCCSQGCRHCPFVGRQ
jgi:hypothetical protein